MNTGIEPSIKLFPDIISTSMSGNSLKLDMHISPELSCFEGHFLGNPVLPGVVQLQWAVHFAGIYFKQDTSVQHIERLKFTSIIQPGLYLTLSIDMDTDKRHANFRFDSTVRSPEQSIVAYSQGRLIYANTGL